MHVIGTAGHVDHGKSTLVHALTGIDPDRLQEEKERGMTIDLGFAWLRLPGGEDVSIVDVPGHERFIKNMLAGVGGIDLALLVIAADEGVMPQTEEHVAILETLRVTRAVVALTKTDLVDAEWLELVRSDVADFLDRTSLRDAPIVPVSAHTGAGLPELLATIERGLADTPPKPDVGRPRLPVDRVFTVAGFGTVVTGTLSGGRLHVGQEVEILPAGLKSRLRGVQTHRRKVEEALPGSRVALNLTSVSTDDVRRGDVVATAGWLRATTAIDAHLIVAASAPHPVQHNSVLTFHTGAAETTARVLLLEPGDILPGESGWAQLRLTDPVTVVKGDLFVLRTPNATLGGGEVVDSLARRHRRRQADLTDRLRLLQQGSPLELVVRALDEAGPLTLAALAAKSGLPPESVATAVIEGEHGHALSRLDEHLVSTAAWRRLVDQAEALLGAYHRQYPLRSGMPREELKSRLKLASRLYADVLARLVQTGIVTDQDGQVRRLAHQVTLTEAQQQIARDLEAHLTENPFAPPALGELRARLPLDEELLHALSNRGDVVLLGDDVILARSAYDTMVERVTAALRENGALTVSAVRDLLGSSRKYSLALLEHLDHRRVTRRVGDERVLR